jgi:magnesium transporter
VADGARWIDLLDPSEEELRKHAPRGLRSEALTHLLRRADSAAARPTLQGHDEYVFGVFVVVVAVPGEDRVYQQEIDLVLTHETVLTVRKTPPAGEAFDVSGVRAVCEARGPEPAGMVALHVAEDVAERYLDVLSAIADEIDEFEETLDEHAAVGVHRRMAALRRDLLTVRTTLGPTRDAVRRVIDGRVDIRRRPVFGRELFPRPVEIGFTDVYDKLLRASEALDLARDLLATVRDFHQSRIAADQNEVVKRLTAVASLLLFPTFWVGVYGQNFEHMPELGWRVGYALSWAVIVVVTIVQLVVFRRRGWL